MPSTSGDVFDRFYIPYTAAKGSTEKRPRFNVDPIDVPSNEVLSYFVVERWEYDTRHNRLRPVVEAICPVLHRAGDFGGEPLKYPDVPVKFNDLRPHLAAQTIFVDDDNNPPTRNLRRLFTLTMYDGDIYKTRNLKNRSMVQLYPTPTPSNAPKTAYRPARQLRAQARCPRARRYWPHARPGRLPKPLHKATALK